MPHSKYMAFCFIFQTFWKLFKAFLSSKGIRRYRYAPKDVMTVVARLSFPSTRFCLEVLTRSIFEMNPYNHLVKMQRHGYEDLNIFLTVYLRYFVWNDHTFDSQSDF